MDASLFQLFNFRKKIEIEDMPEGHGDEIVAMRDKIIIKGDTSSFKHDLAEMLSLAKLGEDDPLLATFLFQPDISSHEEKYASIFFRLCRPLQGAWTYKTMRKYAPHTYDKEIAELLKMWEKLHSAAVEKVSHHDVNFTELGIWAILFENPANKIDIIIRADNINRADWEGYISTLKHLIHMDPDADLYLRTIAANALYQVKIITNADGFRYFEVKEKI